MAIEPSVDYLLRVLHSTASADQSSRLNERARLALNQAARNLLAEKSINVGEAGNA